MRFVCFEKPLEQMWHLKGHEPEWTYMCDFKSPGVGKDFEQRLHLCGFSYIRPDKKCIKHEYFLCVIVDYIYCLWYILEDLCRENCDSISTHQCYGILILSLLLSLIDRKNEDVDDFETSTLAVEFQLVTISHTITKITEKNTRMKCFPFDLHKYDYALIVLVIWFHDFTLV